jgi:hypothetical protein
MLASPDIVCIKVFNVLLFFKKKVSSLNLDPLVLVSDTCITKSVFFFLNWSCNGANWASCAHERRDVCQDIHWEPTLDSSCVLFPPQTLAIIHTHTHKPSPLLVLYTSYVYPRISSHRSSVAVLPRRALSQSGERESFLVPPPPPSREYALLAGMAFNPPPPPTRPTHRSLRIYQEEIHGRCEVWVPSIHLSEEGWQKLAVQKLGFGTGRNEWVVRERG